MYIYIEEKKRRLIGRIPGANAKPQNTNLSASINVACFRCFPESCILSFMRPSSAS